eukprot:gene5739-7923_t
MNLLDDDQENQNLDTTVKINRKFAAKYEQNARQNELKQSKALFEEDLNDTSNSDSESETEDEEADMITPKIDLGIIETINSIRKKDPIIYSKDKVWFQQDETEDISKKTNTDKKKRYKDILREQLLSQGADPTDVDDHTSKTNRLLYDKEQKELREAFINEQNKLNESSQSDNDSDESDLVMIKKKSNSTSQHDEIAIQTALKEMKELGLKIADEKVAEEDEFLTNYLAKKLWKDKTLIKHDDFDYEQEEQELEKIDNYESKYNFRFEELQEEGNIEDSVQVKGYARKIDGSVRRVDERRKLQREAVVERKEKEKRQKEEELKRLKNLKRQELQSRLKNISDVAGLQKLGVIDENILDEDWDPEKHEALMNAQYNDSYYNIDDIDLREERLAIGDDDQLDYDGYVNKVANDLDYRVEDEEYEEVNINPTKKDKINHEVEKLNEELYQLDYEDIVAGLPTRFKYKQVEPDSYGLSVDDILLAEDAELNQFMSLKHISAYYANNSDEMKVSKKRKRLRAAMKERLAKDIVNKVEVVHPNPQQEKESQQVNQNDVQVEVNTKKKRKRRKNVQNKSSNQHVEL